MVDLSIVMLNYQRVRQLTCKDASQKDPGYESKQMGVRLDLAKGRQGMQGSPTWPICDIPNMRNQHCYPPVIKRGNGESPI